MLNIFFREDIEDVDDVAGVDETPERLPISKIGKSKSEEIDLPGDRSTTGTTGEKTKLWYLTDTFTGFAQVMENRESHRNQEFHNSQSLKVVEN